MGDSTFAPSDPASEPIDARNLLWEVGRELAQQAAAEARDRMVRAIVGPPIRLVSWTRAMILTTVVDRVAPRFVDAMAPRLVDAAMPAVRTRVREVVREVAIDRSYESGVRQSPAHSS